MKVLLTVLVVLTFQFASSAQVFSELNGMEDYNGNTQSFLPHL